MLHRGTGKQNGIIRCWEPSGEISVYTSKQGQLHGLCICLGPGELQACRVTFFQNGKAKDSFYLDTQTGVIRSGVEGGNGILTEHLSAMNLLHESVMYARRSTIEKFRDSIGG